MSQPDNQQIIDSLMAQCDAAKQMHNEGLNSNLQLRVQVNLMQKQLQKLINDHKELNDKYNALLASQPPELPPSE